LIKKPFIANTLLSPLILSYNKLNENENNKLSKQDRIYNTIDTDKPKLKSKESKSISDIKMSLISNSINQTDPLTSSSKNNSHLSNYNSFQYKKASLSPSGAKSENNYSIKSNSPFLNKIFSPSDSISKNDQTPNNSMNNNSNNKLQNLAKDSHGKTSDVLLLTSKHEKHQQEQSQSKALSNTSSPITQLKLKKLQEALIKHYSKEQLSELGIIINENFQKPNQKIDSNSSGNFKSDTKIHEYQPNSLSSSSLFENNKIPPYQYSLLDDQRSKRNETFNNTLQNQDQFNTIPRDSNKYDYSLKNNLNYDKPKNLDLNMKNYIDNNNNNYNANNNQNYYQNQRQNTQFNDNSNYKNNPIHQPPNILFYLNKKIDTIDQKFKPNLNNSNNYSPNYFNPSLQSPSTSNNVLSPVSVISTTSITSNSSSTSNTVAGSNAQNNNTNNNMKSNASNLSKKTTSPFLFSKYIESVHKALHGNNSSKKNQENIKQIQIGGNRSSSATSIDAQNNQAETPTEPVNTSSSNEINSPSRLSVQSISKRFVEHRRQIFEQPDPLPSEENPTNNLATQPLTDLNSSFDDVLKYNNLANFNNMNRSMSHSNRVQSSDRVEVNNQNRRVNSLSNNGRANSLALPSNYNQLLNENNSSNFSNARSNTSHFNHFSRASYKGECKRLMAKDYMESVAERAAHFEDIDMERYQKLKSKFYELDLYEQQEFQRMLQQQQQLQQLHLQQQQQQQQQQQIQQQFPYNNNYSQNQINNNQNQNQNSLSLLNNFVESLMNSPSLATAKSSKQNYNNKSNNNVARIPSSSFFKSSSSNKLVNNNNNNNNLTNNNNNTSSSSSPSNKKAYSLSNSTLVTSASLMGNSSYLKKTDLNIPLRNTYDYTGKYFSFKTIYSQLY
jgi:hypothetical protein